MSDIQKQNGAEGVSKKYGPETIAEHAAHNRSVLGSIIQGGAEATRVTMREGGKAVKTVAKGGLEAAPHVGKAAAHTVDGVISGVSAFVRNVFKHLK